MARHSPGDRVTVDLQTQIRQIEDRQQEIKGEAEETDRNTPEYRELEQDYEELQHSKELVQADIEQFGGSEYTLKKFTYADAGHVADLVRADAMADDEGGELMSKLSNYQLRALEVGIVSTPPDFPENGSPTLYSPPVGQFLSDRLENLNSYGKVTVQDFSLSKALSDSS